MATETAHQIVAQNEHANPTAHTMEGQEAAHGGAHETGFPPFNPDSFSSQLIWLAISFGILYLLMSRVALPKIATVLEERHDRIADDLDQAEQFRSQTEEAIAAYEKALGEARDEAHKIAQATRDELQAETDRQRQEVEGELAVKIADAESRIKSTKEAAMANVREIAADVAGSVVTQVLGENADAAALERAVDAEIK
ncbi:F0F1 ATP synthase subunit B [Parvibaculum sp.]|jgi:F-type H+-transporting ATPase subunit b|uniref:F0F1 ATP synthase subunit B n=1 Tax=Parvibaculum sp. TaxID=2024848 RepID=UPI000C8FD624|nr:F0F1 ATP synthase subunit B [Parvibaculum sp.]MAB14459.1 F0F1 ATP synthase subunit B' [Parvibaculum sp.]